MQYRQTLTPLKPEKGTRRGTTKGKDAMSPKPATGQEGAGDNEPGLLGQRRSSRQAAARPAIIDVEESAGELEVGEVQGKSPLQRRRRANQSP